MRGDLLRLAMLVRQELALQSKHLDMVEDHLTAARCSVERLLKYAELIDGRLAAEAAAPLMEHRAQQMRSRLDEAARNIADAERPLRVVKNDQEKGA